MDDHIKVFLRLVLVTTILNINSLSCSQQRKNGLERILRREDGFKDHQSRLRHQRPEQHRPPTSLDLKSISKLCSKLRSSDTSNYTPDQNMIFEDNEMVYKML